MPIVIITKSSALSSEQRGELVWRVNLDSDPPSGLLIHMHSEVPDEATVSIDVWETTEQYERFREEWLTPVLQGIADETGLAKERLGETVTTFEVEHPGIATSVVGDYGDEVRRVAAL